MASSIGDELFYSLSGRVLPQAETLEEIKRANVNGQAYRIAGKGAEPTEHYSEADTDSAANAKATEDAYAAMAGTLQTVTYDDGQTRNNVAVLSVRVTSIQKVVTPVGGIAAGSWVVKATWRLQGTE